MKNNKTKYFSIFFLVCFTASFASGIYKNFNYSVSQTKTINSKITTVSSKGEASSNAGEFLFEETGNESEDGFELQWVTLPYFITHFQNCVALTPSTQVNPLVQKKTNPIYISVCNFRI